LNTDQPTTREENRFLASVHAPDGLLRGYVTSALNDQVIVTAINQR
jgi:hypothetical protein